MSATKGHKYFEIDTKEFRRNIPPFRVHFVWIISQDCNYQCSYCRGGFVNPHGFRVLTPQEWFSVWKDIYDKYGTVAIHLCGGEPTLYPDFFEIMGYLCKMHYIEIDTNLSWNPQKLIEKLPPNRVSRIGTSFHPEHTSFEPFFEKVLKLKKASYKIEINYTGYPSIINQAERYFNIAKKKGIEFILIPFHGEYQGKKYPESYNAEEKEIFRILEVSFDEIDITRRDWEVNKGRDKEAIKQVKRCRKGQMYAFIESSGEAYRCELLKNNSLGNIIERTVTLRNEAVICKVNNCTLWQSMIVGEEKCWVNRWPGTQDRM